MIEASPSMKTIRVLVADDHEVVRSGLATLLRGSNIEIVAEATDVGQVVPRALEHQPDVTLLDVRMPGGDGFAAMEELQEQCPATRVVVLSTHDNPTYVARSAALGASDYLLKGTSRADLISSIMRAASGEGPGPQSLMTPVASALQRRKKVDDPEVPLTRREFQVVRHIAFGLSNREIGNSLGISVETVKEHVQNLLRKLKFTDRTQAAVWAIKKGLV